MVFKICIMSVVCVLEPMLLRLRRRRCRPPNQSQKPRQWNETPEKLPLKRIFSLSLSVLLICALRITCGSKIYAI